ncbi:hypothetical protein ANSO36C_68080 (plasmid) [Nostoc cf. commune SO-36]|uniref:Orc1-like AAA ATPase domain-containing protein n=1 Tax=Nostoc cf. commune SO-36 TaxID=449208 RepID=A0ABM7ZCK9_NOSCO|nr:hypothetical protein [Nostoc commune]BDI21006.1 hypothetical protein ANSO36C_68080 [Nostoc cf. commune SO-36]
MFDLSKVDLGNDEAEQDKRLREYFLKTSNYKNALAGKKTIVIGRKGSGKSAIFRLMQDELETLGSLVIPITPDQYSWSLLRDYKEIGISLAQAHTNAWKMTLLSSVLCKLHESNLLLKKSELFKYSQYMRDAYTINSENWFLNLVNKAKNILSGVKIKGIIIELRDVNAIPIPLKVIEEIRSLLLKEWPLEKKVHIIIDRLDDSWDGSEESKNLIIGLLKAANEINAAFTDKLIVTVFLRSDIYDSLFFNDQDKLRQNEETLNWSVDELKDVVCERVRVSLGLGDSESNQEIWKKVFSDKNYRSKASAEKYIIDRTFKRPRDIISFVRFAIEIAVRSNHTVIEPDDTRLAEQEKYSQSKYTDLIIEYQHQVPYVKDILTIFSGSLHKISQSEMISKLNDFTKHKNIYVNSNELIRQLFIWGVIGIKRQGGARVKQRGGVHFYYYYDDPSINPLSYNEYYIHPSLRYYLNISEKREKNLSINPN